MSRLKQRAIAPLVISGFLLSSLLLLLGRAKIVQETFVHNDDLMRATQLRDFLNGQGWWDLHQYRLGLGSDLIMHWTRHVDALLLVIVLPLRPFIGQEAALKVAGITLPILLAITMLYLVSRVAKIVGGKEAVIPALFFATASLWTLAQFSIGRIDHHNLQIVLAFVMVLGVLKLENWKSGLLAAAGAGIALSVGLEAVSVVAGVMLAAGLVFVRVGGPARTGTAVFFVGTPLIGVVSSLMFAPASRLAGDACDVLSTSTLTPLLIIGAVVVGITWRTSEHAVRRLAGMSSAAIAGLAWFVFDTPRCLSGPYADVDQWFRENLLNGIQETENIIETLQTNPFWAVGWLIPVVASFIVLFRAVKNGPHTHLWRLIPVLAFATVTALVQTRGIPIVVALTPPILAVILLRVSQHFEGLLPALRGLLLAGVILLLSGVLLPLIGVAAGFDPAEDLSECNILEFVRSQPPLEDMRLVAPLNMGPELMFYLPSTNVVGALYHRFDAGAVLAARSLSESPSAGLRLLDAADVDAVLLCDTGGRYTPGSLGGALISGGDLPGFKLTPLEVDRFLLFVRSEN